MSRSRVPDLLLRRGEAEADAAQRSGMIWGRLAESLGQIAGQYFDPERKAREQERLARAADLTEQANLRKAQTEKLGRDVEDTKALNTAYAGDGTTAPTFEQISESLRRSGRAHLVPLAQKTWSEQQENTAKIEKSLAEAHAAESDLLGSGAAYLRNHLDDEDGGVGAAATWVSTLPAPLQKKAKPYLDQVQQNPAALPQILDGLIQASPQQRKLSGEEQARALQQKTLEGAQADRAADNARQDLALAETTRHNRVTEANAAGGGSARIWVMRKNAEGKLEAVRVREGEVQPGDKPANTREQGRGLTSGDANRLADVDVSLGQIDSLTERAAGTGAGSRIGAALPDVVTEATGLGAESKGKQAAIDLVKQIIGRALEGGVLRKEDEIKYAKILPKIGDAPEVARAKLAGLKQTLEEKREAMLASYEDAGYDVTKFRSRTPAKEEKKKADPLGLR